MALLYSVVRGLYLILKYISSHAEKLEWSIILRFSSDSLTGMSHGKLKSE